MRPLVTTYAATPGETTSVKPPTARLCRCGRSFERGRADGVQRSPGEPGLDVRTCECGQTNAYPLSSRPHVRDAQCQELITLVAARNDLPGHERGRRVKDLLEEMREAQAETRRRSLAAIQGYRP